MTVESSGCRNLFDIVYRISNLFSIYFAKILNAGSLACSLPLNFYLFYLFFLITLGNVILAEKKLILQIYGNNWQQYKWFLKINIFFYNFSKSQVSTINLGDLRKRKHFVIIITDCLGVVPIMTLMSDCTKKEAFHEGFLR